MNKIKLMHFIPLNGAFEYARRRLNEEQQYNIDYLGAYSFKEFYCNNEKTFELNHEKKINHLSDDSSDFVVSFKDTEQDWRDISKYKNYTIQNNIEKPDILTSVPPCSSIAMLNRGNRSGDADSANWILEAVKFYLATDAKVLVFENAPGLVGREGLKILNRIKSILKFNNSDDKINIIKTTTLVHGIPQLRNRTFCYIYKSNKQKVFKNIKHDIKKLSDFLMSLNIPKNYDSKIDELHFSSSKNKV